MHDFFGEKVLMEFLLFERVMFTEASSGGRSSIFQTGSSTSKLEASTYDLAKNTKSSGKLHENQHIMMNIVDITTPVSVF